MPNDMARDRYGVLVSPPLYTGPNYRVETDAHILEVHAISLI